MNASHTREAFFPPLWLKCARCHCMLVSKLGKLQWGLETLQLWKAGMEIRSNFCLTSNFNLTNSTGVPKEWGKVTKKGSGNSLPHFLMTPASGTQAADIISYSKADGKFHRVINSHHLKKKKNNNFDLLWPVHMTNQQHTEDQIQALVRDVHMKDRRGDVRRQSVVPAKYFPWPLHVVEAISQ